MMKSRGTKRLGWIWILLLSLVGSEIANAKDRFPYRIVYDQGAISLGANDIVDHIKTASAFGYNGLTSCDFALEKIESLSAKALGNYQKVIAAAKANKIALIPWHFYQQHGAHENINLAEAFPVKGTPFLVSGGKARAISDPNVKIANGGFETGNPVPTGWRAFGSLPSIDSQTKHSGSASVKYENPSSQPALAQMVKNLRPYRAYELSVWIRTQKYTAGQSVKFQVLVAGESLLSNRQYGFGRWGVNGNNGNFTRYKADFNTLGNTNVLLRLMACVGEATGVIWFDDVCIREVGLYETIQREGCPITVKSEDASTTFREGVDYSVDPKCASFTESEDYYYEGHLAIPANSAIKPGQKLRVDWYQLANMDTYIPETNFCLPETWTTLQDNLNHIDSLFANNDFMYCNIDEWRVAGWDNNCRAFDFNTGGEYMAKSWSGIECMLRRTGNGCRTVFVWNDMFDPYHNASGQHILINGPSENSWLGLGEDVIVANWNGKYGEESLRFFAGLDPKYPNVKHRQIVSCADGEAASRIALIKKMESQGVKNIVGMQWVTWNGNYSTLGPVANAFKAAGYWGAGPIPKKHCTPISKCSEVGTSRPTRTQKSSLRNQAMQVSRHSPGVSRVEYHVSKPGRILLQVFDSQGRLVQTLVSGFCGSGEYRVMWKTAILPSGIYFLRLAPNGTNRRVAKHVIIE